MNNFQEFAQKIMSINAPVINVFGGGIPSNSGSSNQGGSTSSKDVIYQLSKDTARFGEEYNKETQDKAILLDISKKIQGSLMALGTLSIMSEEEIYALIDELHSL